MVGMKQIENVRSNLEVIQKPTMTRDEFFEALGPIRRKPYIDDEMEM